MVKPDEVTGGGVTKPLLIALARVIPNDGHDRVMRLDIRKGWGNILIVRLYTTMPESEAGRAFRAEVREAVGGALGGERYSVEVIWDAIG